MNSRRKDINQEKSTRYGVWPSESEIFISNVSNINFTVGRFNGLRFEFGGRYMQLKSPINHLKRSIKGVWKIFVGARMSCGSQNNTEFWISEPNESLTLLRRSSESPAPTGGGGGPGPLGT